jgi:predicted regulator of Ras-like GTPase activity (Roadblock/LC7/MglB family)
LLPNLPRELLKTGQLDQEHQVLLKAAEVERSMATGRPSVLLRAIYNAAPEFFSSEVSSTDLREVVLPFKKVVDQFASFQVRDDQVAEQEYPQLETPFLKVTLEDNERFGKPGTVPGAGKIPAGQPKIVVASPLPVQAAAPVAADAVPKLQGPIRLSMPAAVSAPAVAPPVKAPPALDQAPKVGAAAQASAVPPPKPSAPLPPAASAAVSAAAPTVKAPPALDQAPKVAAAAQTSAAPAPKPSAPLPPAAPAAASAPAAAPTAKAPSPLSQPAPSPPTAAEISPNGAGAPTAERVPASSGSPVPTPLPSPFAPLPPTRIPFKASAPSDDTREPSKFPAVRANPDAVGLANSGPRISLPLRNILREVAPFQLSGPIDAIPDTARIEIPFSIVQPQLSLGRVAISPAQFLAALPEEYRTLFKADPAETPVPLPLQDVLKNLPNASLQLRGDQEEPEVAEAFETPFSQKASEDAVRLKVTAGPISKTTVAPTEAAPKPVAAPAEPAAPLSAAAAEPAARPAHASAEPAAKAAVPPPKEASVEATKAAPVVPAKKKSKPAPASKAEFAPAKKPATDPPVVAAPGLRTALQKVLDTDELLDAKSVVVHVSRLPGVRACAIVFSDGLSLAGNIPEDYEADALCAMAPSILKRIDEQMFGARLGALKSLTLFCAKMPVSLFVHDNICLAALHSDGEIAAEVRDRLDRITQELARMYAEQPNA